MDWGCLSWRVLRLGWLGMLVFGERFGYKAWDASVQNSVFVVPIEGDAHVFASCPIRGDVIPTEEGGLEVIGMVVANKFYAKIIHY